MHVKLTYFKPETGKFYTTGEYESRCLHDWDIPSEVRRMKDRRELPGLMKGSFSWHILIESGIPHLIFADPPASEEQQSEEERYFTTEMKQGLKE